jgi:hypothetical protein
VRILPDSIFHATFNLLITAFRYRQLYNFQNQFISIAFFSYLRDAQTSTSVTRFRTISSPRPLVLRTYADETLGLGSTVRAARNGQRAAAVSALPPAGNLVPLVNGGLSQRGPHA